MMAARFTLEELIARAMQENDQQWEVVGRAKSGILCDTIRIGAVTIQRYDDRVAAGNGNGMGVEWPRRIEFLELHEICRHAETASRKRKSASKLPRTENGLVTLAKLGKPFDWVDVHLTLKLAPAHARLMLRTLHRQKKISPFMTVRGSQRYVVNKAQCPELFREDTETKQIAAVPVELALAVRPCRAVVPAGHYQVVEMK